MAEEAEREAEKVLDAAHEESRRFIEESERRALELRLAAERYALDLKRASAMESAQLYAEAEKRASEVISAARRIEEAVRFIQVEGSTARNSSSLEPGPAQKAIKPPEPSPSDESLAEAVRRLESECLALIAERDALRQSVQEARSELEYERRRWERDESEKPRGTVEVAMLESRLRAILDDLGGAVAGEDTTGLSEADSENASWLDLEDVAPRAPASDLDGAMAPGKEAELGHSADLSAAEPPVEIELVVSPLDEITRLVELERALQTLPEVKGSRVRDFYQGVVTLAISLTNPGLTGDLLAGLQGLPLGNVTILSSHPHRIEARIEAWRN
ncbi:MAG: hypothetical protein M1358_06360 [Chloroflexi bacterium]|nr:hypothetical protein [Chloroflexota bacterium]